MSQTNGRAKRSEKGLLTPDNCVVALSVYIRRLARWNPGRMGRGPTRFPTYVQ